MVLSQKKKKNATGLHSLLVTFGPQLGNLESLVEERSSRVSIVTVCARCCRECP